MSPPRKGRKAASVTEEDFFTIWVGSRHTSWLAGPSTSTYSLLDRLDVKHIWDFKYGAWSIPKGRTGDILVDLDRRHRKYEVHEVQR